MVLPGIIVLIVIVVLLVIGGAIWGILTLIKKKKEKRKLKGKAAQGLYIGPLQNRINQKTDIRIPLIYSSGVNEPTIQFHALEGKNIIGSIMAVFDTGSGQVWVAEDCPLTCKEKVSQECPSCQGLGSVHTKSLSGWNPPERTSKCALTGEQFQNFCQPCLTSNSKLGSCVCKYEGCGPGLCSGRGECNIYYTPRAGNLTVVDSLGNYLTICGYVGIANGESYGIKCGGISGILGMWNFTQPIISPTSFLYNFYNNLGGNCFPQDRLNFSFNSWTDNQTNINMEVVFQDTSVDKTPIDYTPMLPPVNPDHAPFYLIRIKAIKIGGHHYLLDDQHIILDTGTSLGGHFSQKIFCLINQHLPGQMRKDNGCSETLPSFKLAAIPPDAPTIAFKLQGTGKDNDFWITYQPKDYIYTNEALNQSQFNADANNISHLFQLSGSLPNQSLMGNSCFLNRSLTFDLMHSQIGFRNLDSTGQVAKPIMSERAVLETSMPTMNVTKKKLVPLVIKGPVKKIPRMTIAPIPISHLLHSHKLKAVALQSKEERCCRNQEASGWPGCQ